MKLRIQQGFTLVEILLSLSTGVLIIAVIALFFNVIFESKAKHQAVSEVEQQGAAAIQIILQTARNAVSVTGPIPGASGSTLTLTVPTGALSPTVFDLASGVMRITEGAGSAVALTNSRITASALTFQNLSRAATPGDVRITFTLSHVNPTGRNEYAYTRTFYGSASLR